MKLVMLLLFSSTGLLAVTKTVKAAGGGDYTTIQACATAMAAGDTCTVYAGNYAEIVTVTAGTVGNYKTFNVNGTDVVTVRGFTLASHTKLIGNCTAPAAVDSCGFNLQYPSSPASSGCAAIPNGATDIFVQNNVMYACGNASMIGLSSTALSASYIYVQGNTLSYACITVAQAGTATKECNGILLAGDHFLVENNDLSHYTLGIYFSNASYGVYRNNTLHDQYETEAGGNAHTDAFFAESSTATQRNVFEGNYQYTGVGPNAKGILTQAEGCAGNCKGVIYRFNVIRDLDSANVTNDCSGHSDVNPCFLDVKLYNNTYVNTGTSCTSCSGGNSTSLGHSNNAADLNNIYYFGSAVPSNAFANPVTFDSGTAPTGRWGYSLAYCNASGSSNCALYGHLYEQGTWAGETGNILGYADHSPVNNPNFVNLAGSNFHLQSSSPAIAAGTYLTTVASGDSGSGTSLVVTDAAYFQDGYGLTGVQADWIRVGSTTTAQISSIDYSTNTITLAGSISRSNADPIYLYKNSSGTVVIGSGAVPDMGAYPYQAPPVGSSLGGKVTLGGAAIIH